MFDRDDRLIDLAAALADGAPIDWDAAESSAASDSERRQIRRMRLVRELAASSPGSSTAGHIVAGVHESILTPGDSNGSGAANGAPPPVSWGPLKVIEKIGRGRFGDVYLAWDPRLDREVALKLLRHRSAERDALGSSVIEEGRLLAKVRHPNVVTVYGAERIDDRVGVWMELVRGRTLEEELVARGPFRAEEVAAIGVEVCRALGAVHRAGLIHRDVKAQNVMRDEDGRLVLMDFGTGRELDDDAPPELAGTPLYLAPEVIGGDPATPQSDLYSAGVLLYRLLTGAFPVGGRTLRQIREGHAQADRRPGLALPDPALGALVDRALARDPADRFADAADMEAALVVVAQPLKRTREPGRRRIRALAIVSSLLAVAAVAVVVALQSATGPPRTVEHVVWAGEDVPWQAAMSSDGRSLVYLDEETGRIALRDLTSGADRALTPDNVWPLSFALSRDSAQLAYTVGDGCCAAHTIELHVIDVTGSGIPESRLVREHGDGEWLDVFDWSADGTRLAIRTERYQESSRIGFMTIADGTLHVLKSLNWRGARGVSISPDGTFVAYDATADEATEQRDVFVVPTSGGPERLLLAGPNSDSVESWTPDGRSLLVRSQRNGQPGLWLVSVRDGRAAGEPSVVKSPTEDDPIGITTSGAVLLSSTISRPTIKVSSVDFETGRLLSGPAVAPVLDVTAHTQTPMFSPDGQSLAFVSRRPRRDSNRTLLIQSPATRALTELPLQLSQIWTYSWSPDRRSLLGRATDFQGRQGVYLIDAQTGASTPVALNSSRHSYFQPQWSRDGASFYHTRIDHTVARSRRGQFVRRWVGSNREEVVLDARRFRTADGSPFPGMRDWTLSPDGRHVAGITITDGTPPPDHPGSIVWTVRLGDHVARPLLRDARPRIFTANSVHWTPDSRAIVINRGMGNGVRELWRVPLDGVPLRIDVGAPDLVNERFAIHPDGRQIAFMAGKSAIEIHSLEGALPRTVRR